MTPFDQFRAAVSTVAPQAAIVFGSGLSAATEGHFAPVAAMPYADVPGLVPPSVAGHRGRLEVGHWDSVPVVVCLGRVHFYEGHSWDRVTALVRLVAGFGVKLLALTNAAGGIRDDLNPGDLIPIQGHFKLLDRGSWRGLTHLCPPTRSSPLARIDLPHEGGGGALPLASHEGVSQQRRTSPLVGEVGAVSGSSPDGLGGKQTMWQHVPLLESATCKPAGTYAALTGPCYETPAEIRALRAVGADAVGMSTAVEAEAAAELGLTVVGVSCITNKAAGLAAGTLNHHEVEAVARRAVGRLGDVLSAVLPFADGQVVR